MRKALMPAGSAAAGDLTTQLNDAGVCPVRALARVRALSMCLS